MDLASLQTTVARISARLNENLSETARDLGLQGLDPASLAGLGGGAAGRYLEDGTVVTQDGIRETKKLLESRREASMAEGLRRVLAMMLRGLPVITFFPQVVQCLSSSTSSNTTSSASAIQIRSLVSLYILRQAAFEPDLALLAVNMYQKDLRDPNPIIRALAIRTLAGMELDSIVTLVLMSLKTASRDTNWFVRRTVAEALERVYVLDPSHLTSLIPILETGLSDQNPLVTGSSLAALESICPDRLDLIHPHYRRYCKSLVDADEWTQVILLRVLELYARQEFPKPEKGKLDADLQLLLQCTEPLLWNRNPAVVLSVVRVTYRLSPSSFSSKHAAALARLLQAPPEIQGTVLAAIATIASEKPTYFDQHLQYFYVYQLFDNQANKSMKLRILVLLADESNISTILGEFIAYTRVLEPTFRQQVISSIGDCARKVPKVQSACLGTLIDLLDDRNEDQVTAVLLQEISQILLLPSIPRELIRQSLAQILIRYQQEQFNSPNSRSELFRTVSGASHLLGDVLPHVLDMLRRGSKGFATETESGKEALLQLSSKIFVMCQREGSPELLRIASTLHTYLLTLGRYDPSWTIRALTRMYAGLTNIIKGSAEYDELDENAQMEQDAFASGEAIAKVAPQIAKGQEEDTLTPAIQSAILGEGAKPHRRTEEKNARQLESLAGWQKLPDWPEKAPQHNLRDSAVETISSSAKTYRGFGNSPSSSASTSRKTSHQHNAEQSNKQPRRRTEKVVLVPTESYTPPPEKPRPAGLQAFLESSEEDEAETETETETESESDLDSATQAIHKQEMQRSHSVEADSEEEPSSSEEEESDDEQDARAPLVRLDDR